MATYLFTWNPERWSWDDLQDCISQIQEDGYCNEGWSSGNTKKIKSGDRAFLMKLGAKPRGIMASGWVKSDVYEGSHWDNEKRKKGEPALYVDIDWDTILDPEQSIFPRELLDTEFYSKMHWEPQASGTTIPDDVAEKLEKDWAKFLKRPTIISKPHFAEEIDEKTFYEGATHKVAVNIYERDPEARAICINHYGLNCAVCGFNFEKVYGKLGKGFIHVHHLKPISEIGKEYTLNPIKDLRPVCPNCHAMIHKGKPAYSIKEVRKILLSQR